MSKCKASSVIKALVAAIFVSLIISLCGDIVIGLAKLDDEKKRRCFNEYATFEYSEINGELYCNTGDGRVKL